MKQLIFFAIIGMATLLVGCSETNYRALHSSGLSNALINSTTQTPDSNEDIGVYLSLSQRSSLSIGIEGIIDYFKGTPIVDSLAQQQAIKEPWVCYNINF